MDYNKEIERMRKQGNKPCNNFGTKRPTRRKDDTPKKGEY